MSKPETRHTIFTVALSKIGLCAYDNKRYLLGDGITSLSYGHKRITDPDGEEDVEPEVLSKIVQCIVHNVWSTVGMLRSTLHVESGPQWELSV